MTRGPGYLDTRRVHAELGPRSVRSGLFVAAARAGQGVIALAAIAVLARLLAPSDFGVIAMVTPFAAVASNTLNLGLDFSVLHEERLDEAQVRWMFWTAQRRNLLLVGGMALLGWPLSRLYHEPRVVATAALWAVALALQGLGSFHEALLKRQLRLGLLTVIRLVAIAAGVATAIVAARLGAGYIALVFQIMTLAALECAGAWMACTWRPGRPRVAAAPADAMRRVSSYGVHLAAYRAVYWAGRQADRMLVGVVAGAGALGLYDGARRWSWYPYQELFQSVTEVAVTTLSRARHEVARYRAFFRAGMTAFLAITLPAVAFLFVDADRAVRLLLGPRWLGAVPLVRVMCLSVAAGSVSRLTLWLFTAEGRTREQLRLGLVVTPAMIAIVAAGATRGTTGVAWAFTVGTACLTIPTLWFYLRGSVLQWRDFAAIVWRPAGAAAIAAAGLELLQPVLGGWWTLPTTFAADALVFGVLYASCWIVLPGGWGTLRGMAAAVRRALRTDGSVAAAAGVAPVPSTAAGDAVVAPAE